MKKLVNAYNSLEAHILAFSLAFTTLLIFVQVCLRYIFNNSLSWSEELARYIFIWQIWLGTSVAMKEKEHICLDMLNNKLHGKAKLVLALLTNLLMLGFCIFLAKYGWDLVLSMMSRGNKSVALRIPMWIIYSSLPFSQLVVTLRIIGHMVENVRSLFGGQVLKEEGNA